MQSVAPQVIVKYCNFMQSLKEIPIKCLCSKEYRTRRTFSKHKQICLTYNNLASLYLEYVRNLLPPNYKYTKHNDNFMAECEFEKWYYDLNLNSNYIMANSSTYSGTTYKKILCNVSKETDCRFHINMKITSGKIQIKAYGFHNHPLDVEIIDNKKIITPQLKGRSVGPELKEKIIHFFYEGETPVSAFQRLKIEDKDYLESSKCKKLIPSLRQVYHLHQQEQFKNFGAKHISENALQKLIEERKGINLEYKLDDKGSFIIAFATKIMINSLKTLDYSENILCIDSSGGMDRSSSHLFNLVIPGPVGSLSIGMFLSSSETSVDIERGIRLLKEIWAKNEIKYYQPACIMSDDSKAQINALKKTFENSTILLCQFHVLQALWKWL